DVALEHAVLELPFSFWQYFGAAQCGDIPGAGASSDTVLAFVDRVSRLVEYGDAEVARYGPYYVQAASQLGYPLIDTDGVADLVRHPGTDIAETYLPAGVATSYDAAAMPDVAAWVRAEGARLLFVNGAEDPWSIAGHFELGAAVDSFELWVADGNHGAKIGDLGAADRQVALDALARWTAP